MFNFVKLQLFNFLGPKNAPFWLKTPQTHLAVGNSTRRKLSERRSNFLFAQKTALFSQIARTPVHLHTTNLTIRTRYTHKSVGYLVEFPPHAKSAATIHRNVEFPTEANSQEHIMATASDLIKRVAREWIKQHPEVETKESLDALALKLGYIDYHKLLQDKASHVRVSDIDTIAGSLGVGSVCIIWDHLEANWKLNNGCLGTFLRVARKNKQKITAKSLAGEMGVSAATFYKWSTIWDGRNSMTMKQAQQVVELVGLPGLRFSKDNT